MENFQPSFEESIRGRRVSNRIHTLSSDNLMELLLMIDGVKRASSTYYGSNLLAGRVRIVKTKPRAPIVQMIAKILEFRGATRIVTMELHADQMWDSLEKASRSFICSSLLCLI
jgi:ribose-phosphate pyrophosphokinase